MDLTIEVNAIKDLIPNCQNFAILLPDNANRDAVAAALGLYLSIAQMSKTVTVAYSRPIVVGWSHLIGVNKIAQNLGNKNFVISLDYQEGAIEKVSYNIEGNKFNLVIESRVGAPLFDEKKVHYSHSGFTSDCIIVLGASQPEALGKYYFENKTLFSEKPVIVVDNRPSMTQFGKINLIRPAASISEIVAHLIQQLSTPVNSDIVSNLYDGILFASRNFSAPQVSADTFEAAAYCLRQGARKPQNRLPQQEETPGLEFALKKPNEDLQPPPDWLKPKIFKGGSLL